MTVGWRSPVGGPRYTDTDTGVDVDPERQREIDAELDLHEAIDRDLVTHRDGCRFGDE